MPLQIRKSVQQMVLEASREIETLTVEQARALLGQPGVTFIDLRDPRELWREGGIPGAVSVPRGMLEFWIDPASPYHKSFFASGNRFVLFCGGGWRSALATRTAQDMGLTPVCHIEGGFGAWKSAGAPVEAVERKPPGDRGKSQPAS
jgi:rhodanese-related sulfurtransferase